jgi:hypothetical protein
VKAELPAECASVIEGTSRCLQVHEGSSNFATGTNFGLSHITTFFKMVIASCVIKPVHIIQYRHTVVHNIKVRFS